MNVVGLACAGIKISPKVAKGSPKSAPKVVTAVFFYLWSDIFQNSPKSQQMIGLLLQEMFSLRTFQNRPILSHWFLLIWHNFLTNWRQLFQNKFNLILQELTLEGFAIKPVSSLFVSFAANDFVKKNHLNCRLGKFFASCGIVGFHLAWSHSIYKQ